MPWSKPFYYDVKLDEENIICGPLAVLQDALRHVVSNPDINRTILSQWWAMRLVDYTQLKPLIENRELSEQERMQKLFSSFNHEKPEVFRKFLTLLCNLKGCEQKAQDCREIINQHFPNSVVLVCHHGNEGPQIMNLPVIMKTENEVSTDAPTPLFSENVNKLPNKTVQATRIASMDINGISINNTENETPSDSSMPLLSSNVNKLRNEASQTAGITIGATNGISKAVRNKTVDPEYNSLPTNTDSCGLNETITGLWNKSRGAFGKRKKTSSGIFAFILLLIIAGVGLTIYAKNHSSHEAHSNEFNETNSSNVTIPVINDTITIETSKDLNVPVSEQNLGNNLHIDVKNHSRLEAHSDEFGEPNSSNVAIPVIIDTGTMETSKSLNVSVSERDLGNGLRKYRYVQRNNVTKS